MKNIAIEDEMSKVLDLILAFMGFSTAVEIYRLKKSLPEHL